MRVTTQEKIADPDMGEVKVTIHKLLLPSGQDIAGTDRIVDVKLRGEVLEAGPLTIKQIIPRNGPRGANHILLILNEPK